MLPEVFLKAVALARNRGIALAELTTVNLDFVRQYRPQTNVVSRPTAGTGRGYSLIGHHEIMIPSARGGRRSESRSRGQVRPLVVRAACMLVTIMSSPAGVAQLVESTRLISAGSAVRVRPPAPTSLRCAELRLAGQAKVVHRSA